MGPISFNWVNFWTLAQFCLVLRERCFPRKIHTSDIFYYMYLLVVVHCRMSLLYHCFYYYRIIITITVIIASIVINTIVIIIATISDSFTQSLFKISFVATILQWCYSRLLFPAYVIMNFSFFVYPDCTFYVTALLFIHLLYVYICYSIGINNSCVYGR